MCNFSFFTVFLIFFFVIFSLDHCRYFFPVVFARINSCIFLVLVSFWLFCSFETSTYFHLHG
uniref:Uncharacterized protein n=1 Tax=Cannabis sativa TaxID=3483 RepID=A0A803RB70_CANSA